MALFSQTSNWSGTIFCRCLQQTGSTNWACSLFEFFLSWYIDLFNWSIDIARPAVQAQRFGQSGSLNEGRGPKKLRGWRLLRGKLLLLLLEFIFPKAVSSFFSMTTLLLHTLLDHRLCSKSKSVPMKKISWVKVVKNWT